MVMVMVRILQTHAAIVATANVTHRLNLLNLGFRPARIRINLSPAPTLLSVNDHICLNCKTQALLIQLTGRIRVPGTWTGK